MGDIEFKTEIGQNNEKEEREIETMGERKREWHIEKG